MSDKNFKVKNGIDANGASTISSSSLSDTTFSVSNISGQYGLIQAWNVVGSTTVQVDGNGHFYTLNGRGVFVNSGWIGSTRFAVTPWQSSAIGMIVRGQPSQTGDLAQFQDSSSTILAKIDSSGNATFNTVYVGLGGGSQSTNIALGGSALLSNTTGFGNSAIGIGALQSNTTGWGNTAIGTYALQNYSGNVNTAIGYLALRNATTEGLVAIGYGALANNGAAYYNTAVGYGALTTTVTGGGNVAFGTQTLANATGSNNTGLGTFAGRYLTTGTDNVFIGQIAAQGFTTGSSNVVIGSYAAWYGTSTGSNNVFIGKDAGGSDITGNNNIAIGQLAQVSSSSVSNEVTIGNSSITKFRIPGTGFISDTSKTYSSKELDLRDISTQFTNTGTGSVGQKINLWGGTYGIGIEAGRLVNYIPSTSYFVIKSSYGGSELFSVSGSGATTFSSDVTVSGNFTVNGTTTNLNSTNLVVEDKNIIIADVTTPTDTTADGAGITIKGATDKTFNWVNSTKSFTTSDPLIINNTSTTTVPLIAKGYASQTSSFFEVQDSASNKMFAVYPPAGSAALTNASIWIRPAGNGGRAQIGATPSYGGFGITVTAGQSLQFGTMGGGTNFEIVANDTFNRYKVLGNGTGVAPVFTTDGLDTDVNMNIYPKGAGKIGINTTSPTGYVHAISSSSSTVGLIVEGASGQTSTNIFEVQRAGGGDASFGVSHNYIDLNRNTTAAASMTIYGPNASAVPLYVKGRSSQTGDLTNWLDSNSNILSSIKSNGSFYVTGNSNTTWISGPSTSGTNQIVSNGNDLAFSPFFDGLFAPANSAGRWRPVNDNTSDLGSSGQRWKTLYSSGINVVNSTAANVLVTIKAAASQTANLQEWQDSSGNVLSRISAAGSIFAGSATRLSAVNGDLLVAVGSASVVPIIARGYTSQTADLQQWQNSAGTVLTRIASDGSIYRGATTIDYYGAIYTTETMAIGASNTQRFASGGMTIINRELASSVIFGVKGIASQTGDLTQWRNSSDTILAKVDANGNFSAITKSFDIPHPTKENMRLRYASLEGPENGVYIRGIIESNIIELPEYWTGLVHEDSITVSLTAVGSAQNIYVEKIEDNKVYIGGELTKAFFTVYGERKDIDKLVVEY